MSLPVLLPPPSATTAIDPGFTYTYVIAQSGATSFTVDPAVDFTLSVTNAGVLSIRFTGTIPQVSTRYSITIHATNSSGTVDQIIPLIVTFDRQQVNPNITSAPFTQAGIRAPVSYRITSDDVSAANPTLVNFFARGLPTGLTCNLSTGVISGTPPDANATYAIVLGAYGNSQLARAFQISAARYWILTVGIGSALTSLDTTNDGGAGGITGGTTGFGNILYDGDYTQAQLAGQPIFEAPFLPEDPKIYLYRVPFWQFRVNYTEPALDSSGLFGGLYVGTVKGSFKDIGGGIIEFWREYATVPNLRNQFESFVYSYQIVGTVNGALVNNIGELPLTVMSRVQYDYFQTTTPFTSIALPRAPRVASVPLGNDSELRILNGWDLIPIGAEMLAEDACARRWKGNIYERTQRFVVKTIA